MKHKDREKRVLHRAEVLGCADKATGKYNNWYNLMLIEPTDVAGIMDYVNLSNVEDLQVEPTVTNASTTNVGEDIFVTKDTTLDLAKQNEIKSCNENNV